MKKIRLTERELLNIISNVILESEESKVDGPYVESGKQYPLYYIFKKNERFYIYITETTGKEPYLPKSKEYSNNGKGYNSIGDAKSVIKSIIRSHSEKPI